MAERPPNTRPKVGDRMTVTHRQGEVAYGGYAVTVTVVAVYRVRFVVQAVDGAHLPPYAREFRIADGTPHPAKGYTYGEGRCLTPEQAAWDVDAGQARKTLKDLGLRSGYDLTGGVRRAYNEDPAGLLAAITPFLESRQK